MRLIPVSTRMVMALVVVVVEEEEKEKEGQYERKNGEWRNNYLFIIN